MVTQGPDGHGRLQTLCRNHQLGLVYLFGSQASLGVDRLDGQKVRPKDALADLDIGVVTSHGLPEAAERLALYSSLHNGFEDLFHPLRPDVVLLEEGHSVFQAEAVKGICIYQVSEDFRDEYEMRVLRRAADFAPVLRAFHQDILEEV